MIAGAGCAGLSALWEMVHHSGGDRRIVVVDRAIEPRDDRTWSFWGSPTTPFAHLADRTWDQVHVRFPGRDSVDSLHVVGGRRRRRRGDGPRRYMRVRSRDYGEAVLDAARRSPNVRFVSADIREIRDEPDHGVVVTSTGELRAPVVFQSVQLSPNDAATPVRHPLRQHFSGWEVHTERPVFDPDVVTLMDFDTDQRDGTAFFYVLPDSPNRALVEHTMFSPAPRERAFHDEQVRARVESMGAGSFTVERTEYGSIPMEDRLVHQRWGRHVWNLGTVGGMTKPTTGYTFRRIHAQTRHLVSSWLATGAPTPLPSAPARYRFADRTLLHLLHERPELGRPIFEQLFATTSIDQVLTFLDEDSSALDDARMIARLPWRPFVAAAAAELGSGLSVGNRPRRRPAAPAEAAPPAVHAEPHLVA